jgi:hypothetical protein
MKYILLLLSIQIASCIIPDKDRDDCVRGKFIGNYCDGYVIQLLDNRVKGKDWEGMHNGNIYKNSLVASLDTTVFNSTSFPDPLNTRSDSIFYFKFKEGGYPRQKFNVCEPSPFVTVTITSPNPCLEQHLR